MEKVSNSTINLDSRCRVKIKMKIHTFGVQLVLLLASLHAVEVHLEMFVDADHWKWYVMMIKMIAVGKRMMHGR